jgi:hypothetical protein
MSTNPRRVHLRDVSFAVQRTYCGHGGPTFSAPITDDPAEATCKTCLRTRRKVVRYHEALAAARRGYER